MKTAFAPRASAILYDILRSRRTTRPFLLPANICPIVPITFLKDGTPIRIRRYLARFLNLDLDLVEGMLKLRRQPWRHPVRAHVWRPDDAERILSLGQGALAQPGDHRRPMPVCSRYGTHGVAGGRDALQHRIRQNRGCRFGGFAFLQDGLKHQHHGLAFDAAALPEDVDTAHKQSVKQGTQSSSTAIPIGCRPTRLSRRGARPCERVRQLLPATLAHRREINAVYNSLTPAELH